ncbi:hypothetical protein HZZ02_12075 [Streptococcus danieliae]|nr:hypothetical protein [Streptococcus danieliae]
MLEIGGQESLLFLYDGILLVFRGALDIIELKTIGELIKIMSNKPKSDQVIQKFNQTTSKRIEPPRVPRPPRPKNK